MIFARLQNIWLVLDMIRYAMCLCKVMDGVLNNWPTIDLITRVHWIVMVMALNLPNSRGQSGWGPTTMLNGMVINDIRT